MARWQCPWPWRHSQTFISLQTVEDPMVDYWCRVRSLALTHTHNDVAILVQRRTLLSIFLFLLSRPPPVCTKVGGCVSSVNCQDWSLLFRECGQGLVPWSEVVSGRSSPLFCLFVANACLSCLVLGRSLQLGSWACYRTPPTVLHTITTMSSGLCPKPCPSFGSLPKPCSCMLSNHLGFGPRCLSGMFSTLFHRR